MRLILGVLALLLTASGVLGQVSGRVTSVGFDGVYRSGCWTPVRVEVDPGGRTAEAQIQILQRDTDFDTVAYVADVTLTAGGRQVFEMVFLPESVAGGLPLPVDAEAREALAERLKVFLRTDDGELVRLALPAGVPRDLDRPEEPLGSRLWLLVGDRLPPVQALAAGGESLGLLEGVTAVRLDAGDLPTDVRAYDAVDAVFWLGADPGGLRPAARAALERYVSHGGHLVLSQQVPAASFEGFGELLPVTLGRTRTVALRTPLWNWANPGAPGNAVRGWGQVAGPFRVTEGKPKPGAVVDATLVVPEGSVSSPETPLLTLAYLVRRPFGSGCVTWVAEDLADGVYGPGDAAGWAPVLERVAGLGQRAVALPDDRDQQRFSSAGVRELGATLTGTTDLTARGTTLVSLAVVFFVGYWLLAGPGLWLLLAARKRTHLSWFAFGVVAVAAAGLTLGVVRLVLGGEAELRHASLVRQATGQGTPGQTAAGAGLRVTRSQFGVYVPRDVTWPLSLTGGPGTWLAPYSPPPDLLGNRQGFARPATWEVPLVSGAGAGLGAGSGMAEAEAGAEAGAGADGGVSEAEGPPAARVEVPFRSTSKTFFAGHAARAPAGVTGRVRLVPPGLPSGLLTNQSGANLANVYLAYRRPVGGRVSYWALYLPAWPDGETLDLTELFERNDPDDEAARRLPALVSLQDPPSSRRRVWGEIGTDWAEYWFAGFRDSLLGARDVGDLSNAVPRSIPMISFFDLLPAMANRTGNSPTRNAFFRSGVRTWDVSPALRAGNLVVLAQASAPLPMPLAVDGQAVPGQGVVVFQFVVPMEE
ncbi:MAG: hypothetical protein ACFCVE_05855 [Phycisphaerae bacterium]